MTADELRERARTLERAGKLAEARDAYVAILEEAESEASGVDWVALADLQRRMSDAGAAANSYARAAEAFAGGGLRNNAIAACQARLSLAPEDETASQRLAELSIEQGYRGLARPWTVRSLLGRLRRGDVEPAVRLATSFAERFPHDSELWEGWAAELVGERGEAGARESLHTFYQALSVAGSAAAAEKIRDQLDRLGDGGAPPEHSSEATGATADLKDDFLGPGPAGTPSAPLSELASVERLDGLETTHGEGDVSRLVGLEPTRLEDLEPIGGVGEGDDDALPLLDRSPPITPGAAPDRPDEDLEIDTGRYAPIEIEGFAPTIGPDELRIVDTSVEAEGSLSSAAGEPLQGVSDEDLFPMPAPDGGEDLPLLESPNTGSSPADDARSGFDTGDETDAEPLPFLVEEEGTSPFDLDAIRREIEAVTHRQVEAADPSTHYDLGVAFKEMGLLEESIAQLGQAIGGGFNPVATLEVLGEVLSDRGDHQAAARILRLAAADAGTPDAELVGVLYWLARSEESLGNPAAARELFDRVIAVDPSFRDASERVGGRGR